MTAPASLGRFEILRPLGRGAAGEVYLARDPLLDRTVALKAIRLDAHGVPDPEGARRRFLREAKITARLAHPHIVVVHEFGEAGDVLFLAMEYVAGGTLARRMQRTDVPFPMGERLLLMAEVAEALAYAHGQGVLHRDLKPANVLLAAPDLAKVSDFGIGKIVGAESDLTASGEMIGSPAYMSPEQMRGEPVDARSDLFSFGIVLYHLLAGRKPFPAETLPALVRQVQHESPPDPREVAHDLPPALAALALRCLEKDPAARPADAGEIARTLRTFLPVLADGSNPSGAFALHRTLASQSGSGPSPAIAEATVRGVAREAVEEPTSPTVRLASRRRAAALACAAVGLVAVSAWALLARARGREAQRGGRVVPTADSLLVVAPTPAATPTALPAPPEPRVVPAARPTAEPAPPSGTLVRVQARSGLRLKIDPDQARVFVDGRFAGVADDWDGRGGGALLTFSSPGRRRLRVAYPAHADLTIDLEVSPRAEADVVELSEKLLAGTPSGPTGPAGKLDRPDYRTHDGIRLAIGNPEAEVLVDGKREGLASQWRQKELRLRTPAVHEVTIRAGAKKVQVRVLAAPSVAETATVDESLR